MIPRVTLREALSDPTCSAPRSRRQLESWRTLLIAAMGESLRRGRAQDIPSSSRPRARASYNVSTNSRLVIGRAAAKSSDGDARRLHRGIMRPLRCLVPGERGVLLCVALDQRVAKIILDYTEASFERSPILKQLIAGRTADALELTNGITLEVRPASFRKLRGPTYVAVMPTSLPSGMWTEPTQTRTSRS